MGRNIRSVFVALAFASTSTLPAFADTFGHYASWIGYLEEGEGYYACSITRSGSLVPFSISFLKDVDLSIMMLSVPEAASTQPGSSNISLEVKIDGKTVASGEATADGESGRNLFKIEDRIAFVQALRSGKVISFGSETVGFFPIELFEPEKMVQDVYKCLGTELPPPASGTQSDDAADKFSMARFQASPLLVSLPFSEEELRNNLIVYGAVGQPVVWGSLGDWLLAIVDNATPAKPLEQIEFASIDDGRYRGVKIKFEGKPSVSVLFYLDGQDFVLSHIGSGDVAEGLPTPADKVQASVILRLFAGQQPYPD